MLTGTHQRLSLVDSFGCFLVLRKLLSVRFCVVVWVLFSVFSIFCITSLVSATPRNHHSFTVRAGDTVLSRVYQFKYLGVKLDPYLSQNDHIDYIWRKISAKLGMLLKARKVIPRESCLTLYNTMITPVFDYCAVV